MRRDFFFQLRNIKHPIPSSVGGRGRRGRGWGRGWLQHSSSQDVFPHCPTLPVAKPGPIHTAGQELRHEMLGQCPEEPWWDG